jgi:peptidoglycan/LPS O-acetylase OafA/YrhL
MSLSIGEAFQPKSNGINFLKLVFAIAVVYAHSFLLNGIIPNAAVAEILARYINVAGFFCISGFLIFRGLDLVSNWRLFLLYRFSRLYPAYWFVLALIAFVFAPLSSGTFGWSNLSYILSNASMVPLQWGIAGTLEDAPNPGVWDGSIWTLQYELALYLFVLALSTWGIMQRKWVLESCFGIAVIAFLVARPELITNAHFSAMARFALMFFAGALCWRYRNRIPVKKSWIWTSAVVTGLAGIFDATYFLVALPYAVLIALTVTAMKSPRVQVRVDLSYAIYLLGFPVQQLMHALGWGHMPAWLFGIVSLVFIVPLAYLMRIYVELPARKLIIGLAERTARPRYAQGQAAVEIPMADTSNA